MAGELYLFDDAPYPDQSFYTPTAPLGSADQLPTQSDQPAGGAYNSFLDLMGSIGTTARDVGTAVGTVRADLRAAEDQARGAVVQYRTAQHNANTGNRVGQFWQYATPVEKVMVGLAIIGVGVAVWAALKKD